MGGSVALAGLGSGKVDGRRPADPGGARGARPRRASAAAARSGAPARRSGAALARDRAAPRRPALADAGGIGAARRRSADPARAQRRHLRWPDRARRAWPRSRPRPSCRRRWCSTASSTARSRAQAIDELVERLGEPRRAPALSRAPPSAAARDRRGGAVRRLPGLAAAGAAGPEAAAERGLRPPRAITPAGRAGPRPCAWWRRAARSARSGTA